MIQVCLSVQEFATQLLSVLVWVELLAQLAPVASGSAVLLQVQIILSKWFIEMNISNLILI